jgi:hypothetical protein
LQLTTVGPRIEELADQAMEMLHSEQKEGASAICPTPNVHLKIKEPYSAIRRLRLLSPRKA